MNWLTSKWIDSNSIEPSLERTMLRSWTSSPSWTSDPERMRWEKSDVPGSRRKSPISHINSWRPPLNVTGDFCSRTGATLHVKWAKLIESVSLSGGKLNENGEFPTSETDSKSARSMSFNWSTVRSCCLQRISMTSSSGSFRPLTMGKRSVRHNHNWASIINYQSSVINWNLKLKQWNGRGGRGKRKGWSHLAVLGAGFDAAGVQIGHLELVAAVSAICRQNLTHARRLRVDRRSLLEDGWRRQTDARCRYLGWKALSGGKFQTFDVFDSFP